MLEEVSSKELSEWKAYFNIKKRLEDEEFKKQKNKTKAKNMNTF